MEVSLVATVKDAGPAIGAFLDAVRYQTRPPDELVIVDGGSIDGTLETLRSAQAAGDLRLIVLSEPGANIARGRNLAIRAAAHQVIAVSDADCVPARDWLERLLVPLLGGADVAAGFYRPLAMSFFEVCSAAVSLPEPEEMKPGWMPSARSVAFRREAFEAAGGYPEWLDIGEDMYLDHRFVETGARIEPAADAVVYWRVRPTLASTWRQYARYAEGDARAGMYPKRHLIRFGAYGFAAAALITRDRRLLRLAALGGAAYAWKPVRRAWRRLPEGSTERWKAVAVVPALMVSVDAAKATGYVRGLIARRSS